MSDENLSGSDTVQPGKSQAPKLLRVVTMVFAIPAVAFVVAIVALLFADVIGRYAFGAPIAAAPEIAMLFGSAAFVMALPAVCALSQRHGGLNRLSRSKWLLLLHWLVAPTLQVALLLIIAFAAMSRALQQFEYGDATEFLGVPTGNVSILIAFAMLLAAATTILCAAVTFFSTEGGEP